MQRLERMRSEILIVMKSDGQKSKARHPQSREEGHPSTEKHTPESRNNTIPTEGLGSKAD